MIFTANVKQEEDSEYKVWDKIESKKYPIVCPHCGAPHNPNEARCEYCDGYMKEEQTMKHSEDVFELMK